MIESRVDWEDAEWTPESEHEWDCECMACVFRIWEWRP